MRPRDMDLLSACLARYARVGRRATGVRPATTRRSGPAARWRQGCTPSWTRISLNARPSARHSSFPWAGSVQGPGSPVRRPPDAPPLVFGKGPRRTPPPRERSMSGYRVCGRSTDAGENSAPRHGGERDADRSRRGRTPRRAAAMVRRQPKRAVSALADRPRGGAREYNRRWSPQPAHRLVWKTRTLRRRFSITWPRRVQVLVAGARAEGRGPRAHLIPRPRDPRPHARRSPRRVPRQFAASHDPILMLTARWKVAASSARSRGPTTI